MMIPRKQLADLGFVETKEKVFRKLKRNGVRLYRDYRGKVARNYGYRGDNPTPVVHMKEYDAIEKIEKVMIKKEYETEKRCNDDRREAERKI